MTEGSVIEDRVTEDRVIEDRVIEDRVTEDSVTPDSVTPDSVTDRAVYLHVTIQLVRGKHRVFAAAMAEMAPVLESQGWRLVGAFTPGIGRLGAVYHLWRIPSPAGALDALEVVRAHPDAARWHAAFAESVADEALQLVRPMPYSRAP